MIGEYSVRKWKIETGMERKRASDSLGGWNICNFYLAPAHRAPITTHNLPTWQVREGTSRVSPLHFLDTEAAHEYAWLTWRTRPKADNKIPAGRVISRCQPRWIRVPRIVFNKSPSVGLRKNWFLRVSRLNGKMLKQGMRGNKRCSYLDTHCQTFDCVGENFYMTTTQILRTSSRIQQYTSSG